jgi:hypothetical protein
MIMSKRTIRLLTLLAGLSCPILAKADDLFQLFFRGSFWVKTGGEPLKGTFTEQSWVNKVARDNKLDPSTLVFVYRPNRRDTVVVKAASGAVVADVVQFGIIETNTGFFDITNSAGTFIIRQASLFDEQHQNPIGSIVGAEYPTRDRSGNLSTDSFAGAFQFSLPELNAVFYGQFYTGARVVDTTGTPP